MQEREAKTCHQQGEMRQRPRLLSSYSFKLGFIFAILILAATSTSLLAVYFRTKPMLLSQMGNRLLDIGRTASYLFSEEEQKAIEHVKDAIREAQKSQGVIVSPAPPGEYRRTLSTEAERKVIASAEYQSLVNILRKIKSATRREVPTVPQSGLLFSDNHDKPTLAFASLFTPVEGNAAGQVAQFIVDADYDHPTVPAPPGNLLFSNSEGLKIGFSGETGADSDFRFEQGMDVLTAAVPLFDERGTVVAVLGLYYDAAGEVNYVQALLWDCLKVIGAAVIIAILAAWLLASYLARDMRKLRQGAERVSQHDFSVSVDVQRSDELGLLAAALNEMFKEIRKYARGLEETNTAYGKFVPRQILECLGQQSITSVRLGDQVQRQMTILFADIRSFTSLSEAMSPRDNFDFINQYLGTIGPIIRKHGGFIDKYLGDGIMALFPERPEEAVAAAIAIQKALIEFNEQSRETGRPEIKVGIGIHRGNLMLGTIGELERMDGTVISDVVNACSRLEKVTKEFGASIIMSESVLQSIPGKRRFSFRSLGKELVKGKEHTIRIYEVIDGDEDDSARRKTISADDFEHAVKAYENRQYLQARKFFRQVLRVNRKDTAARVFLSRCKETKIVESSSLPLHPS